MFFFAGRNPATPNTTAAAAIAANSRAIRGSTSLVVSFVREPDRAARASAIPRIAAAHQVATTPQAKATSIAGKSIGRRGG